MRTNITLLIAVLWGCIAHAQIIPSNDARTKVTAEVEGRGGDCADNPANGHLYSKVSVSHNFLFTRTTKLGIEAHHAYNNSSYYDDERSYHGNHNYQFGVKGMHTLLLKNHKPLMLSANIYAQASQYGVEYVTGNVVGMYMYQISQTQQQGVGLVLLPNSPSHIYAVPIYVLRKTFDEQWSLQFMAYLASLDCKVSKELTVSMGYAMSGQSYWIKVDGEKYLDYQSVFSPQAQARWQPLQNLTLTAAAGYHVAMSHRLYTSRSTHKVADLTKISQPFVKAQAMLKF